MSVNCSLHSNPAVPCPVITFISSKGGIIVAFSFLAYFLPICSLDSFVLSYVTIEGPQKAVPSNLA